MVLIHILGLLDIAAGFVIILLKFGLFKQLGIIFSIIIAVKAVLFINDISSILDLISAVFLFLAAIDIYFSFTWVFSIWLLQKGFFSLLS